MLVGTLKIWFVLRESHSLKDKRRVVKGLKERLFHRFRVAVAEVDHQDTWQRATLGVAAGGTDGKVLNSVLSKVIDAVRFVPGAELLDYELEMF